MSAHAARSNSPAELARQIAARMSPEALLSAEDVGSMLGYPARYIRETIALAAGIPGRHPPVPQ